MEILRHEEQIEFGGRVATLRISECHDGRWTWAYSLDGGATHTRMDDDRDLDMRGPLGDEHSARLDGRAAALAALRAAQFADIRQRR